MSIRAPRACLIFDRFTELGSVRLERRLVFGTDTGTGTAIDKLEDSIKSEEFISVLAGTVLCVFPQTQSCRILRHHEGRVILVQRLPFRDPASVPARLRSP